MALAVNPIRVEAHRLDFETGIWCGWCALPSAASATYVVVTVADLIPLTRFRVTVCDECGRETQTRVPA